MGLETLLFYAFGGVAVAASLLVVGQRNPMYSVMLLIVSFVGLGGLYILLDAPFLAVIQIIIYAGAILVLFLFVVMLLNAEKEQAARAALGAITGPRRAAVALSALFAAELGWAIWQMARTGGAGVEAAGRAAAGDISSVRAIGQVLFTDYALAFEVTSLLILVAMLGAVVLAKREV